MAKTLTEVLNVKGYEAEAVHSGQEALEKVKETTFDCALSDIKMPDVNGVELYRAIKEEQPDLPVVLMTAYSSDSLIEEGLEEGAIAVLSKPLELGHLLSFFSFLRKEQSVTIVDDDPKFCKTLGDILRARSFAVSQIKDPHGVVEQLEMNEVLLLDMKLNSISGLDVLKQVRKKYPNLPVILVTGYREKMGERIEKALELGAYTCLYKPLDLEKLFQLLTEIRHGELRQFLKPSAI